MKRQGIVGNSNSMYIDSFMPITEIVLVELGDVDNLAYFSGTIGEKKSINYYDIDYTLLYRDVFEYSSTENTEIVNIKRTNKNQYKGLFDASTNVEPVGGANGDFYYVAVAGIINTYSVIKNDVLIKLNNAWVKGKYITGDNKWVAA